MQAEQSSGKREFPQGEGTRAIIRGGSQTSSVVQYGRSHGIDKHIIFKNQHQVSSSL